MADNKRIDEATGTETVGHEWDGIEELDTPMPRWWLYTLYACIVFALGYSVLYPAWPMLHSATKGVLGWSSQTQFAQEMQADTARKGPVRLAIARMPIERLEGNPAVLRAAEEGGRAAFRVNCIQCHGSGAAGGKGYPNLNDDDWLWGGNIAEIHQTLQHGIRQPGDDATRLSQMPAFGRDGILKPAEIADVVSYVRVISHQDRPDASARRGAALFVTNCAACHGPDGKGQRLFGAPNLTDAIWLYGGDRDTITQTVTNARYGVMPAWSGRLDPVTIKMLAAYVHSLGGGEAQPAPPVVAAATEAGHARP
jgi:cytochrome c oxidase cbb3-type subunit 3